MATAVERRITDRVGDALGREIDLATPMTAVPTFVTVLFPILVIILIVLVIQDGPPAVMLGMLAAATLLGLFLGLSQRIFVVSAGVPELYKVKPFSLLKPSTLDRQVDPKSLVVEFKPRGPNYRTMVDGKRYLIKRRFLEPYAAYVKSIG